MPLGNLRDLQVDLGVRRKTSGKAAVELKAFMVVEKGGGSETLGA